ncbi:hypothetical protein N7540_012511 [Penicillium herquei]|nr:hypothetical protein N7540_012511 [Penicillium herquei]
MDQMSEQQFQQMLSNFDSCAEMIEIEPFHSFFDPNILSVPGDLFSFPPLPPDTLPPIAEEEPGLADLPPLEDDGTPRSIQTSVVGQERDHALALAEFKLECQIQKQEEMQLELNAIRATLEKIRKYHIECLNPWVESVTVALQNLGCMQEETPASATDGEFDINIPVQH